MDFMIIQMLSLELHDIKPKKCRYMVIGNKNSPYKIMLKIKKITSSNEEKLLSNLLESKLNFESHISSLCRKAGQKINALAR